MLFLLLLLIFDYSECKMKNLVLFVWFVFLFICLYGLGFFYRLSQVCLCNPLPCLCVLYTSESL